MNGSMNGSLNRSVNRLGTSGWRGAGVVLVLALGPIACGEAGTLIGGAASSGAVADLEPIALPSCEVPLGGPPLPANSTEGRPGFDEELYALDLGALAPRLDLSKVNEFSRATLSYLLGRRYEDLGESLSTRELVEQAGRSGRFAAFGPIVAGAFAKLDPAGQKGPDLTFLRRGLYRYYACSAAYPLTLAGFRAAIWDYTAAPSRLIESSMPKAGPRRLYEDHAAGVYVAETLAGEAPAYRVRETEVQLTRARADGSHDFLTYDEHGQQIRTSTFATSGGSDRVAASPYTCMACHYDRTTRRFDARIPAN